MLPQARRVLIADEFRTHHFLLTDKTTDDDHGAYT
jgi:hypothetical protein